MLYKEINYYNMHIFKFFFAIDIFKPGNWRAINYFRGGTIELEYVCLMCMYAKDV